MVEDTVLRPNRAHRKMTKKPTFRGKIDQMHGHVFQLPEESRKANQYKQTMEALRDYVILEFKDILDLMPFFEDPCQEPVIPVPPDEAPKFTECGKPVVPYEHRLFIFWASDCKRYHDHVRNLKNSKAKLFTVIMLQCSQRVKIELEFTPGYKDARENFDCKWLLTTLKNICQ